MRSTSTCGPRSSWRAHYAEHFATRGSGHLVFISSIAGKVGSPYASMYNASKFGLRGFGQGLRAELGEHGVGVSVVFPGFIRDAGMFVESGADLPKGVGTSSPEEVAEAVATAVVKDRGEIDVAPVSIRVGAKFASVAPATAARVNRLMGGEKIGSDVSAGQTAKR